MPDPTKLCPFCGANLNLCAPLFGCCPEGAVCEGVEGLEGIWFKNHCLCTSASCCCWCLVALYELCVLTRLHEVASKVLFSFALGDKPHLLAHCSKSSF